MTINSKISQVQCTDGQFIKIDFMGSIEFEQNKVIGRVLVEICELTIENRGYSGARRLVLASGSFLKYIDHINPLRPKSQQYLCYSDLDVSIFRAWYMDIVQNESSSFGWRYFCALRSAIKSFHESTNKYSIPPFPSIRKPDPTVIEPLDDDCVQQLITSLRKEVDRLYVKAEFQEKVQSEPKEIPYTSEYFEEKNKYSLENIAAAFYSSSSKQTSKLKKMIGIYNQHHPSKVCPQKFIEELKAGVWELRAKDGVPPSKVSIAYVDISIEEAIGTFLASGYPLLIDLADLEKNHKLNEVHKLVGKPVKTKLDIVKLKCFKKAHGNGFVSVPEVLEHYFPTARDQAVLLIFIMLQTGWNKETVLALEEGFFEHALSQSIDSNTTIIESTKRRGQIDSSLPFDNEKAFTAISHNSDRYSAVNLIRLALKLSKPLESVPFDFNQQNNCIGNIFSLLNSPSKWSKSGRVNSLASNKAQIRGIKEFLASYEIFSNNKRLENRDDLLKRLRSTWVRIKQKGQGSSHALLQMMMGHQSGETTDVYYDSSATATYERKLKLGDELSKVMTLLRTHGFKGKLAHSKLKTDFNRVKNRNSVLFTDPIRNESIFFCKDSTRPDWYGCEKYVADNQQCFNVHKCLHCSQCVVTSETLPYLIDREVYIDKKERELTSIEYSNLYGEEHNIIRHILENWPDQDAVCEAEEYQSLNSPLLPADLKLLVPFLIKEVAA